VGGLPGVGKTTVARLLEERLNFVRLDSDRTRKRLAGLPESARAGASFEEGIYTPAWTRRTYSELRRQAMKRLFQGERVLVDASFGSEEQRQLVWEAAHTVRVPAVFLLCRADREVVKQRIASREGGPSDADWEVYCRAAERWEPVGTEAESKTQRISTCGSPEEAFSEAADHVARILHETS
jgi:predicted kinase